MVTFDCYGTLIDWEGGAAAFLYELARRHDREPPPGRELREQWERLQFGHLSGDYRSYRDVLDESLAEWAGDRGYRWNENDGEAFARAMESWQPFPDTVPALRAAKKRGLRLWIISNTDRAIIEHSLRHLEVEFDGVTVAEDCRAYKPSRVPFDHALRDIDAKRDEILHVAFGFEYDIDPAQQVGLSPVWVTRKQEAPPGTTRPDHEWRDLWLLADLG